MGKTRFESRLQGGHHNSLGNTVAIVEEVLTDPALFDDLFQCYFSDDEVVRLRVSNAMKRIAKADKAILLPYMNALLDDISAIDQASVQWTLAQLFKVYEKEMDTVQIEKAKTVMKRNLIQHTDWIVLNQTMDTLAKWSRKDEALKIWLLPQLQRLSADSRKSVAKRASKLLSGM